MERRLTRGGTKGDDGEIWERMTKAVPPASWRTPNCMGGPLDGLKLIGVRGMGSARAGGRNDVPGPAVFPVNGERRSFALLRPIADSTSQNKLRDRLEAYKAHEAQLAAPSSRLLSDPATRT